MTPEMRQTLARLPYAEKLRRVAELIGFSRRFKMAGQDQLPNRTTHSPTLPERSARVDWEKVDAILARVSAVPPQPGDER